MSISSQICKHIYQADGQTREFEIDFPLLSEQDISIYVTTAAGTETKITANYAVNLAQAMLIYPTVASGLAPVASGSKVTLVRNTPLTQEMTLTQQGVLDAKVLEGGYDKVTLQLQEVTEQLKRCIKYTVSSGKTEADAASFLAELQAAQTAALNSALASVEAIKTTLLQSISDEASARIQGDLTLQQNLQTLAGTVSSNDSTQTAALSAESLTRQQTDADLENNKLSKTQAADTYIALTQKAAANGVATLDANATLPEIQLPIINGGSANA